MKKVASSWQRVKLTFPSLNDGGVAGGSAAAGNMAKSEDSSKSGKTRVSFDSNTKMEVLPEEEERPAEEAKAKEARGSGETYANGEGTMDAGETDGTADIPEEYRDAQGEFKMMPVPRSMGTLTRRRPPLALIVGLAGAGKSRLGASLLGRNKDYRAVFRVGTKTTSPKVVVGEKITIVDTPGLPDPYPKSSDAYYNETVQKLRQIGYANAIIFILNQEKVTPTLIKNYGILYRALNKLPCVKLFVCRMEASFVLQNVADQHVHEMQTREIVNNILESSNLKRWKTKQFFVLTNGSGEEQDKQLKYIREQVKASPRVDITPDEGLMLTTEVAARRRAEAMAREEEQTTGASRQNGRKTSNSATTTTADPAGKKAACTIM